MGRVNKEPVEWQALAALDAETQSDSARDTINPCVQLREPNFRKLSPRLDKYTKGEFCGRKVNTATLSLPPLSKISSNIPIVNDKGKKKLLRSSLYTRKHFFLFGHIPAGNGIDDWIVAGTLLLISSQKPRNRETKENFTRNHKFSFLFVLLFWTLHNRRLYGALFATALTWTTQTSSSICIRQLCAAETSPPNINKFNN